LTRPAGRRRCLHGALRHTKISHLTGNEDFRNLAPDYPGNGSGTRVPTRR
jgi:hypothetical protein